MDSLPPGPSSQPVRLSGLPAWVRPNGRDVTEADAAFAAGIALKSLDDLVRSDPAWAGCWRSRQALKCAAAAVRLMGRTEDDHALRDAVLLTAAGDNPGPAGNVVLAYKRVSSRKPGFSPKHVSELAELLGLAWDETFAVTGGTAADKRGSLGPVTTLRRCGSGDNTLRRPSGFRASRLGACRYIDRRKTQVAGPSTTADGRAIWARLPYTRGKRARPTRGTGVRHGGVFGVG
jgi:hypothetical protein